MLNPVMERSYVRFGIVIVGITAIVEMCLAGDFFAYAAVLELVAKDLHFNEFQSGLIQGGFGVTYALGLLFWSPLGRRIPARNLFLIGLLSSGILMPVQAAATTFPELLVLRMAIGFCDGAVWVGAMKAIMEWVNPRRRGLAMGVVLAAYSLAISLDFAIGLSFAMQSSWRHFFVALGIITIAFAIISWLIVRRGPYSEARGSAVGQVDHSTSIWLIFRSRWIWIAILAIFGDLSCIGATATWVIPNFMQAHALDPSLAPKVGSIMGLAQIVVVIIGGYCGDKLSNVRMIQVGAFLTVIASALLVVVNLVGSVSVGTLAAVAAFSGVSVFSGGVVYSLVNDKYGSHLGPAAAGYAAIGGVLGTFFAPAFMGWILTATTTLVSKAESFAWSWGSFTIFEIIFFVAILALLRGRGRAKARAV